MVFGKFHMDGNVSENIGMVGANAPTTINVWTMHTFVMAREIWKGETTKIIQIKITEMDHRTKIYVRMNFVRLWQMEEQGGVLEPQDAFHPLSITIQEQIYQLDPYVLR